MGTFQIKILFILFALVAVMSCSSDLRYHSEVIKMDTTDLALQLGLRSDDLRDAIDRLVSPEGLVIVNGREYSETDLQVLVCVADVDADGELTLSDIVELAQQMDRPCSDILPNPRDDSKCSNLFRDGVGQVNVDDAAMFSVIFKGAIQVETSLCDQDTFGDLDHLSPNLEASIDFDPLSEDTDGDGISDDEEYSGGNGSGDAECGNGIIEEGEVCDGTNLNNQTCYDRGYARGALSCSVSCIFDVGSCVARPTNGNGIPVDPSPSGVRLIGENHPNLFYNQSEIDELRRMILVDQGPSELVNIYNQRCKGAMAQMPHPLSNVNSGGTFYKGVDNMKAAISYMVEPSIAKAQRAKDVLFAYMYYDSDYYPSPYYAMRPGILADPQAYGHIGWPLAWLFDLTYHSGVYSDEEKAEIKEYFTRVAGGPSAYENVPDSGYGLTTEGNIERRGYTNWPGYVRSMKVVAALLGNDQGKLDWVTKSGCDQLYTDTKTMATPSDPDYRVCNVRDLYQVVNGSILPSGAAVDWYVRDRGAVDSEGNVTADYPRVYHMTTIVAISMGLEAAFHNGWDDAWLQDASALKRAVVWQLANHPVKYFNGSEVSGGAWPHGNEAFIMRRFYNESPEIRAYFDSPKSYLFDSTRPLTGNIGRVLMFPLGSPVQ